MWFVLLPVTHANNKIMCIFIVSLYTREGMCACTFKDTFVDDIEENYEHDFLSKVGFIS